MPRRYLLILLAVVLIAAALSVWLAGQVQLPLAGLGIAALAALVVLRVFWRRHG